MVLKYIEVYVSCKGQASHSSALLTSLPKAVCHMNTLGRAQTSTKALFRFVFTTTWCSRHYHSIFHMNNRSSLVGQVLTTGPSPPRWKVVEPERDQRLSLQSFFFYPSPSPSYFITTVKWKQTLKTLPSVADSLPTLHRKLLTEIIFKCFLHNIAETYIWIE